MVSEGSAPASSPAAPQPAAPSRTALVTGSSNGIGEAVARQLARRNYLLVVHGRCAGDVARVAGECARLSPGGHRPLEVVADLAEEAQVDRLFGAAAAHFGGRLHLLVNNAGFGQPVPAAEAQRCWLAYKRIMRINIDSAVRLSLLAAPLLRATALEEASEAAPKNGPANGAPATTAIVNISSVAASRPNSSLFAYSCSKAALNMLTSCLAAELAPQVRVNCVTPGAIETKIAQRSGFSAEAFRRAAELGAPLARIGAPDEVARAVLYLADPAAAAYVTGANLAVDGGALVAPMRWD